MINYKLKKLSLKSNKIFKQLSLKSNKELKREIVR